MRMVSFIPGATLDAIEEKEEKEARIGDERVWLYAIVNNRWVSKGTGVRGREEHYNKRGLLVSYYPLTGLADYSLGGNGGIKPTKVF